MSSLRSELHVAQQIRRDKLRIQNTSQHLQDFPNQPPSLHHQEFPNNSDLLRVRNGNMLDVDDETAAAAAAIYSSEMMISFVTPSNPLPAPRNDHYCQELSSSSSRQFGSFSHLSSSTNVLSSSKDDQCSFSLGNWRNSTSHQFSDWMLNNYTTSSVPNPNSFLVSELNNNNNNNINYLKPSCNLLTDLQSPPPPSSSPQAQLYHNALQDIFKSTTSTSSAHDTEMSWGGNSASTSSVPIFHGNEQLSFGTSANVWTNTNMGSISSDSNPPHQIQGLSLSLSSNSASYFEEGFTSQYSKPVNDVKPIQQDSIMGKGTVHSYRNVGPLGPFTGYATILKSSRFLRPCQQLLDEWCCCQSRKQIADEWVSRDVSDDAAAKGNNSGASSSMFYASKAKSTDDGSSSFCLSSRPECQKNKAKLLYMQEEVMRRYKQYHQQMQLVVSSFESVAGLSCATPYISLALKSVSRHFKGLKNAISDQLRLICELLGEDISIPTTCTSSKIDNNNIAKLRCMDHSFQNNKSGGSSIHFVEHQQHVWRPQRGLPERSVAILKAWLFEHFLHPYPTDTDKHILATQTGLSRNQVSNWFINARVRVWKPMVEEIHMLETKTTREAQQHNIINDRGSASASEATHPIAERQFQCLKMGSSSGASGNEEKGTYEQQWNQEKRSKLECEVGPNMHGTVMGFMPYRRGGVEVGGLGSVSLTLGLRHGVEGVQHQQQLQQEVEFRRQFGGPMIHDFVG